MGDRGLLHFLDIWNWVEDDIRNDLKNLFLRVMKRCYIDKYVFDEKSEVFLECCRILDTMIPEKQKTKECVLDEVEITKFQQLINLVLKNNKEKFLKNLFNSEMTMDELWIEFPKDMRMAFEVDKSFDIVNRQDMIDIHQKLKNGSIRFGY